MARSRPNITARPRMMIRIGIDLVLFGNICWKGAGRGTHFENHPPIGDGPVVFKMSTPPHATNPSAIPLSFLTTSPCLPGTGMPVLFRKSPDHPQEEQDCRKRTDMGVANPDQPQCPCHATTAPPIIAP